MPRYRQRSFGKRLGHQLVGFSVLLLACVFSLVSHANEPAGTVILATGVVSAQGTDGQVRVLAKGSPVFPGDRISSASKSLCVLKMIDDAKMTIKAQSEIVIDDYQFQEGGDEDSSVLTLVKGGFRAVTGLIGSTNPEVYDVNSDLSVLGIRGTDYETRMCGPGQCVQVGGEGVDPGQYTETFEGIVTMRSKSRLCVSAPNQSKDQCEIVIEPGNMGIVTTETTEIVPKTSAPIFNEQILDPRRVDEQGPPVTTPPGCEV